MYAYLFNNGEEYDDYQVVGIVLSPEPIDWNDLRTKMEAWLNEHAEPSHRWNFAEEIKDELFAAFGLTFLDYTELVYHPQYRDSVWYEGKMTPIRNPRWLMYDPDDGPRITPDDI